jgi:carboxypeptidase C (cathepsin A)
LQLGSKALLTLLSRYIAFYLNRPEVRTLLGVDTSVTDDFTGCSNRVGTDFSNNLDEYHPTQHYVAALLERNVNVLIYVGKYDWICNHVGNEAWTLNLEWSGHDEFSTQPLREWKVDGKTAGMTRSAQGLTFATIDGAGHMVCYSFSFLFFFCRFISFVDELYFLFFFYTGAL